MSVYYNGWIERYGKVPQATNPEGQKLVTLGATKTEKKPDNRKFGLTVPISAAIMAAIYFIV